MTTAASITRKLKTAGYTKAEWLKAGVSTRNEGFLTSQDHDGIVTISWELEGRYRDLNTTERQYVDGKVADVAFTLSALGFNTRTIEATNSNYLRVI